MKGVFLKFLNQKKEEFLQAKVKSELNKIKGKLPNPELEAKTERKIREKNIQEADEKYDLEKWFISIINKVKPNVTTHPAKFTNAKIDTDTSQIFLGQVEQNGYIKTGNIFLQNKVDVSGNSATNTVIYELYELLDVNLQNNQTVLEQFKQNNPLLIELVSKLNCDFETLKTKCLEIYCGVKNNNQTHDLIKQVYFPISTTKTTSYHLLSIKTASMLMYEVKNRIDKFDIWVEGKHIRNFKKENKICNVRKYHEVYGITEIGFSNGDFIKMGNYSYLNVKNKGIAYLLPSIPPSLKRRDIGLPNINFFTQCLYKNKFHESFSNLHKLMQLEINNVNIRNAIYNILHFIVDEILAITFKIRQYEAGWSQNNYYSSLPKNQRIWLDNIHSEERVKNSEWQDDISLEIARWILRTYKESITEIFILGDLELKKINTIVIETIKQDKEFF